MFRSTALRKMRARRADAFDLALVGTWIAFNATLLRVALRW
jgi:hypothetical protein